MAFRECERDGDDYSEPALVGALMESEKQQAIIAATRMLEWICKGLGLK